MAAEAPDVSGARALIKVQQAELDCSDDFATEWQRCKMTGESWGGRGRGGRGVARQYACTSCASRDVRVDNVTLAYSGLELLAPCALRMSHGQRYALIGRNGCGKSSLLERIASGNLPGFPPHLRVGILHQMDLQPYSEAACAVDVCLQLGAHGRRLDLEDEREQLQTALSNDSSAEDTDLSFVAQVVQPAQHSLASPSRSAASGRHRLGARGAHWPHVPRPNRRSVTGIRLQRRATCGACGEAQRRLAHAHSPCGSAPVQA